MKKKYISSNRYKKSSSDSRKGRRDINFNKKLNSSGTNVISKPKAKKQKRKKLNNSTILIIIIIVLLIIAISLRFILKSPDESFFDIFKVKIEERVTEQINMGIIDNVDILDENTKNIIITELNSYTCGSLLRIDGEYNIQYKLLENVEKISNSEYILNIAKDNTLTASVLKSRLNSFNTTSSKYYTNVKDIDNIEVLNSKQLKISLSKEQPFFVYALQLPITSGGNTLYTRNVINNQENMLTYITKYNEDKNIPKTINIYKVETDDEAVNLFKNDKLNVFITNNFQIRDILGKYEYDIRSYRNGECLMLFGNKNSKLFAKKEVRQAIAYSIDKNKILKDIYLNAGEIIDLPYIYSEQKYKYDMYGAQNLLLTNGYTLENNVFTKYENGDKIYLNLKLIVNKQDSNKLKVATYIKEDLSKVGINVTIQALTSKDLNRAVEKGDYDLVLASLNVNENPDLDYINKHVYINDTLNNSLIEVSNAKDINEVVKRVKELQKVMSDEVSCIGIHASTSYLISKKDINEFSDISYMNIFSKLLMNVDN